MKNNSTEQLFWWTILACIAALFLGRVWGYYASQSDRKDASYWEQQYKTTQSDWNSVDFCIGALPIFHDFDREGRGYNVLDAGSVKSCEEGQGS